MDARDRDRVLLISMLNYICPRKSQRKEDVDIAQKIKQKAFPDLFALVAVT